MPSKKKTTKRTSKSSTQPESQLQQHILFVPILILSLVLWYLYRGLFSFPVWFDETLGKALFLGLPVWLYAVSSNYKGIGNSFSKGKLEQGLLLGLAVGGIYGFTTAIVSIAQSGSVVQAAPLFTSNMFWYEFALAMFTGFWETLFFYAFVANVVFEKYSSWSLIWQFLLIVVIFLLFHIPNTWLRYTGSAVTAQMFI